MANDVFSKVQAVNGLLEAGEPYNISVDTYSNFTGYKPQFIIDAMNEFFWNAWGFREISSEIVEGEKSSLVVAQVEVWLKDTEFKPTGYGQARITKGDIGDARKGAQTDAIKKALSYFSIGNRAYQGLLIVPDKLEVIKTDVRTLKIASNPQQWQAWKRSVLGQDVPDDRLNDNQIARLTHAITEHKKAA